MKYPRTATAILAVLLGITYSLCPRAEPIKPTADTKGTPLLGAASTVPPTTKISFYQNGGNFWLTLRSTKQPPRYPWVQVDRPKEIEATLTTTDGKHWKAIWEEVK